MKKEIPPAVIVVVLIVIVAFIGFIGRKAILPPPRVQLSAEARKGMMAHISGQGSGGQEAGAPTMRPGMGSSQHSN